MGRPMVLQVVVSFVRVCCTYRLLKVARRGRRFDSFMRDERV